jgi:preprotein translocase subunit Sss1
MMTTQPQNNEHKKLAKILFVTILIIGILYCVFIPYGAGFGSTLTT